MESTKIDFIYVNFNSYSDTKDSILSLKALCASCNLQAFVYVVDNSFIESEPSKVKDFSDQCCSISNSNFYVVYQPSDSNLGFGAACNKAARHSSSPLIAFVNCDTVFNHNNPSSFLKFLSIFKNSDVALAGPKVLNEQGLLHASCFSYDPISIILKPARHIRRIGSRIKPLIPKYSFFKKRIDRITYEGMSKSMPCFVDWISGCFMVARRSFFEAAGGFDERYFLYFEDVDLCRKARQLSLLVAFDPGFSVVHYAAHESARKRGIFQSVLFNPASRYHIISWIKYIIKWRKDFLKKAKLLTSRISVKTSTSRSGSGYRLDFSIFEKFKF